MHHETFECVGGTTRRHRGPQREEAVDALETLKSQKTNSPVSHNDLRGYQFRAHNRDRTGDLILTKDVLYRLSYVSDLRATWATPKSDSRRQLLSVDEFEVIGNPLLSALAALRHSLSEPLSRIRPRQREDADRGTPQRRRAMAITTNTATATVAITTEPLAGIASHASDSFAAPVLPSEGARNPARSQKIE